MAKAGEINQTIKHFSHQHHLQLTNDLPHSSNNTFCSICKLKAFGWFYNCRSCSFNLHISCSKMPRMLNQPFHPKHPLILLNSPYPERNFMCNACGRQGNGFCYHCKDCSIDLHVICSSMPNSVTHLHPLELAFSPPYPNKIFECDVCSQKGSNHWLYLCGHCEFDAHLSCAISKSRPQAGTIHRQEQSRAPSSTTRTVQFDPRRPTNGSLLQPIHGSSTSTFPARFNQVPMISNGSLYENMIQGFGEGASQQLMQSMLQNMVGGGASSTSSVGLNQLGMLGTAGINPFDPTMGLMQGFDMDPSSSILAENMMQNLGGGGILGGFLGGGLGFF